VTNARLSELRPHFPGGVSAHRTGSQVSQPRTLRKNCRLGPVFGNDAGAMTDFASAYAFRPPPLEGANDRMRQRWPLGVRQDHPRRCDGPRCVTTNFGRSCSILSATVY
jgi:hypothetical protein